MVKGKHGLKRKIAALLAATVVAGQVITFGPGRPVKAFDTTQSAVKKSVWDGSVYEGEGYRVHIRIPAHWDGAYNVSISVINTGTDTIHNWAFYTKTTDTPANMYNAVEVSDDNGLRLLKNAGYNQDIHPGESVEFGYTAYFENEPDVPEIFSLSNVKKDVPASDYELAVNTMSEWDAGGLAQITLQNISENPIEDWILEFDCTSDIVNLWNGVIESSEGGHYVVRNSHYAQNIMPGDRWNVGFLFNGEITAVDNVKLSQITTGEPSEIFDETDPSIVVLDTSSASKDVGRIFFKELVFEDEIGKTPEGLECFRNQLLIYVKDNMSYENVEAYVKEDGAKIVGCIESIGCYQIEYKKDLDSRALELKKTSYQEKPWVEKTGYNLVQHNSPDYYSSDRYGNWARTSGGDVDWEESNPGVYQWAIHEIDLARALVNAGVIDDLNDYTATIDHLSYARIGIYDNEFDEWHPDLENPFIMTWQKYLTNSDLNKAYSADKSLFHGSHVAGILGAEFNNDEGITGVCVKSELYGFSKYLLISDTDEFYIRSNGERKIIRDYDTSTFMHLQCGLAQLITVAEVKAVNYSQGNESTGFIMAFDIDLPGIDEFKEKTLNYLEATSELIAYELDSFIADGYDFLIISTAGNSNDECFVRDNSQLTGFRRIRKVIDYDHVIKEVYGGCNAQAFDDIEEIAFRRIDTSVDAKYTSVFNYISEDHICYDHILCVGAMYWNHYDGTYSVTDFSCSGDRVDILAPGKDIYSCIPSKSGDTARNRYDLSDGTSMAAPFVTGAIGLAYNVDPDHDGADLKKLIIETAKDRGLKIVDSNGNMVEKDVLHVSTLIGKITNAKAEKKKEHTDDTVKSTEACLSLNVTDEDGLPVADADVRIYQMGQCYINAMGGLLYESADPATHVTKAKTDSKGHVECVLEAKGSNNNGCYIVMVDKDNKKGSTVAIGRMEWPRCLFYDGLEAGKTESVDVKLMPYSVRKDVDNAEFQIRDEKGIIYGSKVSLYKGWDVKTKGEPVYQYTAPSGGWFTEISGIVVPDGCYTAVIEKEGYEKEYVEILVTPGSRTFLVRLDKN